MVARPLNRRRRQRGISLVEVLVALLLLMFICLAVAQMFSMALAVNLGAAARTDLTYRAQQTAEAIRWIYSFEERNETLFTTLTTNSGVNLAVQTAPVTLPYSSGGTGWEFWGPNGFNVLEEDAPFRVSYEVTRPGDVGRFQVTVMARAVQGAGRQYPGIITRERAVRYVAIIP